MQIVDQDPKNEDADKALSTLPLRLGGNLTRGQAEDLLVVKLDVTIEKRVQAGQADLVAKARQDAANELKSQVLQRRHGPTSLHSGCSR